MTWRGGLLYLAGFVLSDLVICMLLAVLALAVGAASLWNVHLEDRCVVSLHVFRESCRPSRHESPSKSASHRLFNSRAESARVHLFQDDLIRDLQHDLEVEQAEPPLHDLFRVDSSICPPLHWHGLSTDRNFGAATFEFVNDCNLPF